MQAGVGNQRAKGRRPVRHTPLLYHPFLPFRLLPSTGDTADPTPSPLGQWLGDHSRGGDESASLSNRRLRTRTVSHLRCQQELAAGRAPSSVWSGSRPAQPIPLCVGALKHPPARLTDTPPTHTSLWLSRPLPVVFCAFFSFLLQRFFFFFSARLKTS